MAAPPVLLLVVVIVAADERYAGDRDAVLMRHARPPFHAGEIGAKPVRRADSGQEVGFDDLVAGRSVERGPAVGADVAAEDLHLEMGERKLFLLPGGELEEFAGHRIAAVDVERGIGLHLPLRCRIPFGVAMGSVADGNDLFLLVVDAQSDRLPVALVLAAIEIVFILAGGPQIDAAARQPELDLDEGGAVIGVEDPELQVGELAADVIGEDIGLGRRKVALEDGGVAHRQIVAAAGGGLDESIGGERHPFLLRMQKQERP